MILNTQRNLLQYLRISSIVLLTSISIVSQAAIAANMMPVEIINNTAIADPSQVYVLIKGTNPGQNNDCFMKIDST